MQSQQTSLSSGIAVGDIINTNTNIDLQNDKMYSPLNKNITSTSTSTSSSSTSSSKSSSSNKTEIIEEILRIGRQIASNSKLKLLVIDTENKLIGTGIGKQLAKVSKGKYYYVPKITVNSMERLTSEAVKGYRTL
jgi:hypothetical protein